MTARIDRSFVIKKVDDSPRIRWGPKGKAYQLVRVARSGGDPQLPGDREKIGLPQIRGASRMLVYGERSGGGRDFLDWTRSVLGSKNDPWIFVQGDRWTPNLFQVSSPDPDSSLRSHDSFLTDLVRKDSPEAAGRLVEWARSYEGPKVTLLVRDLGRLPEGGATRVAQALRFASENEDVPKKLRIILVDTSEEAFVDTYDASGLASLCERFRLPWLLAEEVRVLAANEQFNLRLNPEVLDEVMQTTGGQPRLVHSLLKLLKHKAVDQKSLRWAFRQLRDQPPGSINQWQKELVALCNDKDDVRQGIETYVSGAKPHRDRGLPESHARLFYAGWIRFDASTQRWKVSSELHAAYARRALDGVKS